MQPMGAAVKSLRLHLCSSSLPLAQESSRGRLKRVGPALVWQTQVKCLAPDFDLAQPCPFAGTSGVNMQMEALYGCCLSASLGLSNKQIKIFIVSKKVRIEKKYRICSKLAYFHMLKSHVQL